MSDERVTFELSKEYLELVEQAIAREDASFIRETMDGVNPADISQLLDEVDGERAKYVLDVLNNEIGAEVIEELEEDTRRDFLEEFEPHEIAEYLVEMESDDAVDIINDLPVKTREQVIASINDPETAAHVQELMRYDEDCAGGLMAKEMIVANINWNVKETIEEIRRQVENVERIYSVYVVDDNYKLKGRVSIKKIILSGDRVKIQSIYDEDIIHVETYMDEEEVADIMQKYDLDAVPVLNLQGKLVGRITIDDIIDVITDQAEEDRQLMSGISSDVEEDDTIWAISKARLPWLIIGMVGSTLGALTMGAFEQELDKYVTLVFFIPMLMATGGNVGIQSSTLIIQSLANRSNFEESLTKRLIKMLFTAVLTGLVLAVIAFVIVVVWKGADQMQFGFVVGTAIIGVTLLASIMGTITPLILDKLDVNPAIASGPFITTTNDILGIAVYLAIANLLLP
ncbi:magnesium transporter [Roseivirga pacifica]|uniref:magnesium transporter n=1 Tax=Roseivirga pacifica TaxID=1267423 RepID=UPI0020942A43|nr:magnesium transporter [Roseivirga pacifica]MCO6357662.1 magnesium transporter [Roseivirga pacifica]MCO6365915.1 magnesium transporter [Roseivirga pacifica]MCO6371243.1 magnesium transporter [Roseivirga pacifica]MCO6375586.1 magnesium transporter [Roseivirga pacifica]MCO6378621.1 magnesium transporter [Roseivirga pacifica]